MNIISYIWGLFVCTLPIIGIVVAGRIFMMGCQCEGPRKVIAATVAYFESKPDLNCKR